MELTFKKLTPEICEDFLRYFDIPRPAKTNHEEFDSCYCLESHLTNDENERITDKNERREKAKQLIQQNIMKGYLIYCENNVIGWVNCGDKQSFLPITKYDEFFTEPCESGKIKVLYCIDIIPEYRGKGIAHKIIDVVCADAKAEGYSFIEAYPFSDTSYEWQYHGPIKLYESHGFERLAEKSFFHIMRKKL